MLSRPVPRWMHPTTAVCSNKTKKQKKKWLASTASLHRCGCEQAGAGKKTVAGGGASGWTHAQQLRAGVSIPSPLFPLHVGRHLDWWVRSGGGAPAGDPRTGVSLPPPTLHNHSLSKPNGHAVCGLDAPGPTEACQHADSPREEPIAPPDGREVAGRRWHPEPTWAHTFVPLSSLLASAVGAASSRVAYYCYCVCMHY